MPESIVGMHPDDCFPSSYSEGRVRFLKLCEQFDARLHAYDNTNEGAEGEDLSCDVVWYGPDDAEYVMVLVSATHGVEGFSGSAAQTDWLLTGGGGTSAGKCGHVVGPRAQPTRVQLAPPCD